YDFSVHSSGTLQPLLRRDVFANLDGTVDKILVKHGDAVQGEQIVAHLRNTDLDVAIEKVIGDINATREQLSSVERQQREVDPRKPGALDERTRLAGERAQLLQKQESLNKQLGLYMLKKDKLNIKAPIAGQITTWNVEN